MLFGVFDIGEHHQTEHHEPGKDKNHILHRLFLNFF